MAVTCIYDCLVERICVILLYMCPHTVILLHMCPHTTRHTTIYVSSYYMCVLNQTIKPQRMAVS
jgi:hypothetical protein